jgi:DNA-binding protein HU-beta
MNKSELITAIQNRFEKGNYKYTVSKYVVKDVLNELAGVIEDTVASGEEIRVQGLMNVVIQNSPARESRNPRNGEVIHVPAKKRVKIRPSANIKRAAEQGM